MGQDPLKESVTLFSGDFLKFMGVVMSKNIRFLLVFVLFSLLFAVLPAGQSYLTTFFGPVEFVRGKGKPVIKTREFSAVGIQGPFVLHLRNGDSNEKHRVSSAKIWLNGDFLFRTSDFSQQVEGYDLEVELQPQNKLEVEIRSKKGTKEATNSSQYL